MKLASETPSKTLFADRVLARDDLSPEARKRVTRLRDEWAADPQTVVRRPNACKRLDCRPTYERDLERRGKIDSFLSNSIRLIHVSSIYEHLIRQTLDSHPLNKPSRKAPGSPNIAAVRALAPTTKRAAARAAIARPAAPSPTIAKPRRGRPPKLRDEAPALPAE